MVNLLRSGAMKSAFGTRTPVVVPLHYARALLQSGVIARVLPDHTLGDRAANAVYPSRRLISPKVRAFMDFTTECLRG